MSLQVEFNKPEIKSVLDWQLIQEINVLNQDNMIIAKAEIELITLNKHRDALKSYALIDEQEGSTDWELPLNLYFKEQNLTAELCEKLSVKADVKKAKTHLLLEAISVLPAYRNQGIAKLLLEEIAKHYPKVQSITALTMPLKLFVDAEHCEEQEVKAYYQQLELENDETTSEQLGEFFDHNNFIEYQVDEALLNEPLAFSFYITAPDKIKN
ncbi:GNAT family N-acetyltransferase [Thalassotalea castellviae]|uniref:GNAT family N-acetyltransferase n=1 Tax=Thalassotalea castellviae TaxID=3075612 RepID=A0ABU3A5R7_9GAMM|nr:GNAT family N-acetyltransferase [Thalassotalea sp. W431]MDT0605180.1 GNAT family N-acetyltransferase [Thalassotalea sp. W431]